MVTNLGESFEAFLNTLEIPIFVVDQNVCVLGANSQGMKFISKDKKDIQNNLAGKAFQCKYSNYPGGCGQTIHCKSCTIRKAITKTYQSGQPQINMPAYMDLGDILNHTTIRFLISTYKKEKVVLLRIEAVEHTDSEE